MFPVAVFWGSTRKSFLHLALEKLLAVIAYFLHFIVSVVGYQFYEYSRIPLFTVIVLLILISSFR